MTLFGATEGIGRIREGIGGIREGLAGFPEPEKDLSEGFDGFREGIKDHPKGLRGLAGWHPAPMEPTHPRVRASSASTQALTLLAASVAWGVLGLVLGLLAASGYQHLVHPDDPDPVDFTIGFVFLLVWFDVWIVGSVWAGWMIYRGRDADADASRS